jgi:hypothetical protein
MVEVRRGRSFAIAIAIAIGLVSVLVARAVARSPASHPVSGTPYTASPICQNRGVDGEVSLAVDPRSGHMVAAWMQDIEGLATPAAYL